MLSPLVWPDVVVTEESLTRCVSEARVALRDTDQKMIKTVSRRGYAYVGPVKKLDDDPVVPAFLSKHLRPSSMASGDGDGVPRCWRR